jgi:hypothetical protein
LMHFLLITLVDMNMDVCDCRTVLADQKPNSQSG